MPGVRVSAFPKPLAPLPHFSFFSSISSSQILPRVTYTTLAQVKAKLPLDFITEALDDDKDGMIDDDVWTAVAEDAADQVDARIGMRYTTPLDLAALPAVASASSLLFVLETLYQRRGYGTEETNPFLASARAARKDLTDIGAGKTPLTPVANKPQKSVAVFTEPARTSSANGHLSH